jgi:hypothetical protein
MPPAHHRRRRHRGATPSAGALPRAAACEDNAPPVSAAALVKLLCARTLAVSARALEALDALLRHKAAGGARGASRGALAHAADVEVDARRGAALGRVRSGAARRADWAAHRRRVGAGLAIDAAGARRIAGLARGGGGAVEQGRGWGVLLKALNREPGEPVTQTDSEPLSGRGAGAMCGGGWRHCREGPVRVAGQGTRCVCGGCHTISEGPSESRVRVAGQGATRSKPSQSPRA